MSNLRDSFEKIDEYLNGELSGQELAEFKDMMEKHQSLAEEVRLQQLANEAIVELNLADLRKDLKQISLKQKNARLYKIYGSIGTAVMLVSGMAYFMLSSNPDEIENKSVTLANPSSQETSIPLDTRLAEKTEANHQVLRSEIATQKQTNIQPSRPKTPATSDSPKLADSIIQISGVITYSNNPAPEQKAEPVKEENSNQSNSSAPCKTVTIEAFIHIEPACKDQKSSGKITIDLASLKGGKPGYQFSLNDGNDYQAFPVFEHLTAGPAQLLIKDAQGCVSKKLLSISEKNCFKEVAIYPSKGETWTVPVISKENLITISDQRGNILFEYSYTNSDDFAWEGKTTDGQDLPMGQYYYTIKGDKGNIINGYISIFR